jgi:hypothetical protein
MVYKAAILQEQLAGRNKCLQNWPVWLLCVKQSPTCADSSLAANPEAPPGESLIQDVAQWSRRKIVFNVSVAATVVDVPAVGATVPSSTGNNPAKALLKWFKTHKRVAGAAAFCAAAIGITLGKSLAKRR